MSKNLYQKITDIMKDVDTIFKGTSVSMGQGRAYSAVSHDDVAKLLHKPLADAGIWTKVSVERTDLSSREKTNKYGDVSMEYRADVWVEVTFINADKPEEREVCKGFAYAFDSSDKAVGKAESMAVKYVYLKNFVLESTDNEEARDVEQKPKAPEAHISASTKTTPIVPQAAKAEGSKVEAVTQSAVGNGNVQVTTAPVTSRGGFRRNSAQPSGGL